jgi:lysophospholipase L1-like esterase
MMLLLAAAEYSCRFLFPPRIDPFYDLTEPADGLWIQNRRSVRITAFDPPQTVTIGRQGFRGGDITGPKGAKVRRIFLLGDSTTFGLGVGDTATFGSRLEGLLNSSHDGWKYEVINAGVIGWTTVQGLETLRSRLPEYSPDAIVVSFAMNDGELARRFMEGRRIRDFKSGPPLAVATQKIFHKYSRLGTWVMNRAATWRYNRWLDRQMGQMETDRESIVPPGEYTENLGAIIRTARANKIGVVLFPAPVRFRHSPSIPPLPAGTDCARQVAAFRSRVSSEKGLFVRSKQLFLDGQEHECQGDMPGALRLYRQALEQGDPRSDLRPGTLKYAGLMKKVAEKHRVGFVDVQPLFTAKEAEGLAEGLFYDPYHAGPLGHRIIAGALLEPLKRSLKAE